MNYQGILKKIVSHDSRSQSYYLGEEVSIQFDEFPKVDASFIFRDTNKGISHLSAIVSFNVDFEKKEITIKTVNSEYIIKIKPFVEEKKICLTYLENRILGEITEVYKQFAKKELMIEILSELVTKLKVTYE